MDAAEALADLTELSAQIRQAAIVGSDGEIVASTFADGDRAQRFGELARRLARGAETAGETRGLTPLVQLEAATVDGSVFLVLGDGRLIAATTEPEPTVGLVFYDLKHCLRAAEGADAAA